MFRDREAFGALVARHAAGVTGVIERQLADHHLALDVSKRCFSNSGGICLSCIFSTFVHGSIAPHVIIAWTKFAGVPPEWRRC